MEKLRATVAQIAATADKRLPELPVLHRSLLPFLSLAFPVPVISVGNLTWGGNGKTPMVEFIARYLDELGIPPLILSRGYAGGDEAKMLQRHLSKTSVKIGVGANRSAAAAEMFERYGCMELGSALYSDAPLSPFKSGPHLRTEMIGIVILDDGMQHWSLFRNVEVVMINGLSPWGNNHLIPRGSLREPLVALCRADIGVIHHADLVSSTRLKNIVSTVQKIHPSLPIFFSRLSPMFLFEVKNPHSKLPLALAINMVILCVSAIGFPDAFIRGIEEVFIYAFLDANTRSLSFVELEYSLALGLLCISSHITDELGPMHVDRLDFSDHHSIELNDINLIRNILTRLQIRFGVEVIVLVTEKDYDRDPNILREVDDFQIMVLCSSLQIMPFEDRTEEDFRMNLKKLLLST
ncbi:hypothetical protein IEQ34_026687 [Dendrobium chrysotoxum]|uniref:tetraacyldisaccharide 4'-kinase n=1 Tax=Dendrobium chrysotoxum TaxID=161865 RepID=A0AAV7FLT5_DENCH|nr:hypothetical protein IEQ34_026687 [Dendrobium chrysotoxum]